MGDELLGGFELEDDLIRCVLGPFHVDAPGQSGRVRTHAAWIGFHAPVQRL